MCVKKLCVQNKALPRYLFNWSQLANILKNFELRERYLHVSSYLDHGAPIDPSHKGVPFVAFEGIVDLRIVYIQAIRS
eukprot:SAG11_NODE_2147_length_3753_cov_2.218391_3_plen_78_part_00